MARTYKLTQREEDEMVRLVYSETKYTVADICELFGVHRVTYYNVLKRHRARNGKAPSTIRKPKISTDVKPASEC
jgi:transposase-like protein